MVSSDLGLSTRANPLDSSSFTITFIQLSSTLPALASTSILMSLSGLMICFRPPWTMKSARSALLCMHFCPAAFPKSTLLHFFSRLRISVACFAYAHSSSYISACT